MKFERNANYHHQLNCFLVWRLLYFGIQAKLVLDWYQKLRPVSAKDISLLGRKRQSPFCSAANERFQLLSCVCTVGPTRIKPKKYEKIRYANIPGIRLQCQGFRSHDHQISQGKKVTKTWLHFPIASHKMQTVRFKQHVSKNHQTFI